MEKVREFNLNDIKQMVEIWNEVVEDGNVFSQDTFLTDKEAINYFSKQSFTAVAEYNNEVIGIYILHPNNIGRCKHIANASYVVKSAYRCKGVGRNLILHSIETAKMINFKILQFNAVTVSNKKALQLYKKLGFVQLGKIPGGYLNKNNEYIDIIPHYLELL